MGGNILALPALNGNNGSKCDLERSSISASGKAATLPAEAEAAVVLATSAATVPAEVEAGVVLATSAVYTSSNSDSRCESRSGISDISSVHQQ